MEVHKNFSILTAKYLPNTIILPTFGNNDFKYHYQAPLNSEKASFYWPIFDSWFQKHPANSKLLNLDLIKTTFMMEGFYRVNLPQAQNNISVLAMNTIPFSIKNLNLEGEQDMQLQWLEEQLSTAEHQRKFIIANHIYYGTQ